MFYRLFLATLFCFFCITNSFAQDKTADSLRVNCEGRIKTMDAKEKTLDKKPYIYTDPYFFRVYNKEKDYISFQLGKRKGSKIFLYIKSYTFNACIKKDDVVELFFTNDLKYDLKNKYQVNCEGIIVIELEKKDIDIILKNTLNSFRIYTFQKDYDFHVKSETAERLKEDVNCLNSTKY